MSTKALLSAEELAAFSAQLSLTVKTGIPTSEAVMLLMEDAETGAAKSLLKDILDVLDVGGTLSEALKKTGAFPIYMTQMVEIGEASGRLDSVLDSLVRYYEREDNISKSARSAITYPAIMLTILIAIIIVLITKVLPIFQQVYNTLGGEMSSLAMGAMKIGTAISESAKYLITVLVVAGVLILVMRGTAAGRRALLKLGQGMFRKLSDKMAASKFASGMALMLASGLDVDHSVELTIPMIDNERMLAKLNKLKALSDEGKSFTDSLAETGVFTGIRARMLTLGFKSGNLDTAMAKVADGYEKEVDEGLDGIISIIEPTMVALLCVIVGLILLSAMLPLLGVMSQIM